MWCRTILTAVAISCMFTSEIIVHVHGQGSERLVQIKDVICVLLLNGLQKEDLDANTLEKLRRHNVNIYDMNNESLRQACLFNSYLDTGNATRRKYETTENVNEALGMSSTPKSIDKEIKAGDYLKLELPMPESYDNITKPNTTLGFNETSNQLKQLKLISEDLKSNSKIDKMYNLENVSKIEENSGLQIEYMQNRPPLENMVNIWTKLTHNTKKVVTKVATTPPNTDEKEPNVTEVNTQAPNNNGYVHSREMEYISRMIAEYLATQAASTTTQKITTEPYMNTISKQIGELLKKTPNEELSSNDELSDANSLKPTRPLDRKLNYDYMTDIKSIPYKILFENNQQLENIRQALEPRQFNLEGADENKSQPTKGTFEASDQTHQIQDTPYRDVIRENRKPKGLKFRKGGPIRFLDDLLRENNKMKSFPNFFNESTGKDTHEGEEQEIESEILHRHDNYKNKTEVINHNKDSDISFNPLKEATKKMLNKRTKLKLTPADKEMDQDREIQIKAKPKLKQKIAKSLKDVRSELKLKPFISNPAENVNVNFKQHRNKVVPAIIKPSKQQQESTVENIRFDSVLPSRKAAQQKKLRNDSIKPNYEINHNPKILVTDPTIRKYESDNNQYGNILPSIKVAKINQNAKNNQIKEPSELNDSELEKNFELFNAQFKAMQAEANKLNKIANMNDDQPEIGRSSKNNFHSGPNKNQFNIMPTVIKNTDTIQLSRNQVQILPVNLSQNQKFEINNEGLQPVALDIKDLKELQNFGLNMNEPQVIPANVIKEIAERVKQIVLKDMRKGSNDSTTIIPLLRTTVLANASTTNASATNITTTDNPLTPNEDANQHQVIEKFMEMFNEFKMSTARPHRKATEYIPGSRMKLPPRTFPPVLAGFNPYVVDTPPIYKSGAVKPLVVSPYGPGMVPVIISSGANLPKDTMSQYVPELKFPKNDVSGSGAITLQTNSDEIAPLAIRISQPVKLINQHIILTTRNPFEKQKKQQELESRTRFGQKYDPRYRQDKIHLDSEYLKKIRYTDRHEYLYNDKLKKNIEKPKYTHEISEKIRGLSHVDVARGIHRDDNSNQNKAGQGGSPSREFTYTGGLSNLGGMSYPGISHGNRPQTGLNDKRPYTDQSDLEPQYLATKFHEKLERIETWPRNTWFRTVTTENCCADVAARQQVPLAKLKQRTRFDDTHFNNFLKSQQKVTDMLEKILASNTRHTGPHSVELP